MIIPDNLENRFTQPNGWEWGIFENVQSIPVRFGYAAPAGPRALVAILPGRTEFIEKYFETARDLLDRGYAVCVIDWPGQGGSGRISHPHRCDTLDFTVLADDLHALMEVHLPAPLKALPKIMLAQSMGAAVGLRFLKLFPEVFTCAMLNAPLVEIHDIGMPVWVAIPLCKVMAMITGNVYAFGQKDWDPGERAHSDIFTSDKARGAVHDSWFTANPSLRTGGATFNWVYHVLRSTIAIKKDSFAHAVRIPILIALPGHEKLLNNDATRRLAKDLAQAEIIEFPTAAHEILMEREDIREELLGRFFAFAESCV